MSDFKTVSIRKKYIEEIKKIAVEDERPFSSMINKILKDYLDRHNADQDKIQNS